MGQIMDLSVPSELEDLIICSNCHHTFNDSDAVPKLLQCRHYFCLKCVNTFVREGNSDELYCIHCWKRTELNQSKTDNLPTHNAIVYLTQNFNLNTLNLKIQNNNNNHQIFTGHYNNSGNGNFSTSVKERSASIASIGSNSVLSSGNGSQNGAGGSSTTSSNVSVMSNNNNNNNSNNSGVATTNHFDSNCKKVGENCMTHAMPHTLWCGTCNVVLCRACGSTEEHRNHAVKNKTEAKDMLQADITHELVVMQNTMNDVQHLVLKQRDFLAKILECCAALKTQIETELAQHGPSMEMAEMREILSKARMCLDVIDPESPADASKLYSSLHAEKQRLLAKYQEMFLQCKLDDLIRDCGYVFDFDLIKRTLIQLHNCATNGGNWESVGFGANGSVVHPNPTLLLANYCISQLYSRHIVVLKQQHMQQQMQQQKLMQLHQEQQQQQQQHQQQQQQTQFHANSTYHQQQLQQQQQQAQFQNHSSLYNGLQQQQQQQQQAVASANGNSAASLNGNGPFYPTYAQALQQNYTNNKGNLLQEHQQQQQQQHHLQQQQQQRANTNGPTTNGSTYQELQPIGTPASAANPSHPTTDLNELGLSLLSIQDHQQQQNTNNNRMLNNPSLRIYPIYYFNIDINKKPAGRILIEVRNDVAPIMAKNFNALTTQELGYGYKGCSIFQCWEGESIITGDFEHNNGRGGRSVYDEGFFMPDDTKIVAVRGTVGMRRSQKRHDNLGLVGSQFRIILREMRGFTGIFGFVVEGLELVEKISQTGDSSGKAQSSVVIANCGKYQLVGQ